MACLTQKSPRYANGNLRFECAQSNRSFVSRLNKQLASLTSNISRMLQCRYLNASSGTGASSAYRLKSLRRLILNELSPLVQTECTKAISVMVSNLRTRVASIQTKIFGSPPSRPSFC
jgi:hypothetical protein